MLNGDLEFFSGLQLTINHVPSVGDVYNVISTEGIGTLSVEDTITAHLNNLAHIFKLSNVFGSIHLEYLGLHGTPDFLALVALYNATGGPNWTYNTNWISSDSPCDPTTPWAGVSCDHDGMVERLFLDNNNLNGEIPIEIGLLEKIEIINFSNNSNLTCLLYTSPSPRDKRQSRMPSSA